MIYEDRKPSCTEEKAKKTLGQTFSPEDIDTSLLKTLDFTNPGGRTEVTYTTEEFTSLCPFSELPDFGTITIRYIPRKKIIELKSLKYYLYAFRQVRIYMEEAVNKILDDLVSVTSPEEMEVVGRFQTRGGIFTQVRAFYQRKKPNRKHRDNNRKK